MFRRERKARQAQPQGQPGFEAAERVYQMRQRIFAIGDDFYIENAQGERVFYVDGKALRLREKLILRNMSGDELYSIQEKLARIRDIYNIARGGAVVATVKKALISPLRQRYAIEIAGGGDLTVQGNILDHEYTITRGGQTVAEVSKRWFRLRDTYSVEVAPGEDDALILACTAVIDMMSHEGR